MIILLHIERITLEGRSRNAEFAAHRAHIMDGGKVMATYGKILIVYP